MLLGRRQGAREQPGRYGRYVPGDGVQGIDQQIVQDLAELGRHARHLRRAVVGLETDVVAQLVLRRAATEIAAQHLLLRKVLRPIVRLEGI